jgi:hypothetical protein
VISSTSRGLSHETQADLGLCSVAVLVVLPRPTERAFGSEALGEKKVRPPPMRLAPPIVKSVPA